MVVGVELRGGYLHACSDSDAGAASFFAGMQLELAEDDARGKEVLFLAIVFPAEEVRGVRLQLRPHVFGQMILRGRVPGDGTAQLVRLLRRQISSETGNHIEFAEPLSGEKRRCDRGIGAAVAVTAGWDGRDELSTQHEVTLLLVAREKTVLVEEADIPETVFHFGRVVLNIRCVVNIHFAVETWDQVQTSTCSVVPGGGERGRDLPDKVRTENLDQHGIRRDQRWRPRGLPGLRRAGSCLPFGKEVVLGEQSAGCGRQKEEQGRNLSCHIVCVRVL